MKIIQSIRTSGCISNKTVSELLEYTIIILFIMLSKTIFFGLMHEYQTMGVLAIFCVIVLTRHHFKLRLSHQNICTLLLFVLLLSLIALTHNKDLFTKGTFLFLGKRVVYLFLACAFASNITAQSFRDKYVNILVVVSIISVFFKGIQLVSPSFILSITQSVSLPERYIITFFCTFGRDLGLEIRNYGPFWEPGGFSIFIVLAILFAISSSNTKKNNLKLFVLFVTLVTTGSTSAYISLLIILVCYFNELIERFFSPQYIWALVLIVFLGVYVLYSGNIQSKLTYSAVNYSLNDRLVDLKIGFDLFKEHPLFGWGNSNVPFAIAKARSIFFANSNGVMSMLFTFGILFTISYYYHTFNNLKKLFPKRTIQVIGMVLCVLVMHISEEVHPLGVMYLFLFSFRSDSDGKISIV